VSILKQRINQTKHGIWQPIVAKSLQKMGFLTKVT